MCFNALFALLCGVCLCGCGGLYVYLFVMSVCAVLVSWLIVWVFRGGLLGAFVVFGLN